METRVGKGEAPRGHRGRTNKIFKIQKEKKMFSLGYLHFWPRFKQVRKGIVC